MLNKFLHLKQLILHFLDCLLMNKGMLAVDVYDEDYLHLITSVDSAHPPQLTLPNINKNQEAKNRQITSHFSFFFFFHSRDFFFFLFASRFALIQLSTLPRVSPVVRARESSLIKNGNAN